MTTPVAVQPVPRGALGRRVGRSLRDWIPAAIVLVLGLLGLATDLFFKVVQPRLLPWAEVNKQ